MEAIKLKILIISDTHRQHENLEQVIVKESPIDLVIHLGDAEGCEDYIEAISDCPLEIVAGNNDFFSNLDREKVITLLGHKMLLTHGHYYRVSLGLDTLVEEAKVKQADIVVFGHTHIPCVERIEEILVLNPGSISYPRQVGKEPTYIVMQLEEKQEIEIEIKKLKNK